MPQLEGKWPCVQPCVFHQPVVLQEIILQRSAEAMICFMRPCSVNALEVENHHQ